MSDETQINITNARNTIDPVNTGSGNKVDINHHFHLQPSDAPGQTLVNTSFDGRGFPGCRRSVLIDLSAKNKLGFINGSITPPDLNTSNYQQWSRCNHMVTFWLLNSVSKDIEGNAICSKTSRDMWMSLEHRLGKTSGAKLFHLQKEIIGSVQGTLDISTYFTRLKRLWDELDSLNADVVCTCVCICEGQKKLTKSLQDQRLVQFLMGLTDVYSNVRSIILMSNYLPTLDYTCYLLLQDENQREVFANAHFPSETVSVMVGITASPIQKQGKQAQRNVFPLQRQKGNQFRNKGRKTKFNPDVTCNHCIKIGHIKEDCHRLIGYPDDF
ncbi:uncharacterized protein [Solanum tuberosum]|uniref:uncharacterized protein n=1 Tax=Solanum tuberosum TaxID=4113 RepID=UPI000739FCF3|nr:PREDICTED: uncharacterized protein LOC107060416 [Solanum tuberosum]